MFRVERRGFRGNLPDAAVTEEQGPADFAVYLAPGTGPLLPREAEVIHLQAADLLGCDPEEIRPVFVELHDPAKAEFSWIPETEQSREPYLALVALLRSGAHAVGNRCCMLVHDLGAPFPALEYLKGLAEITRLPVLLGVCRKSTGSSGQRQILVRRLR
ncbi:MAG: hypothetical protein P4L83_14575 [Nevskia sp.]|nr:hypothetical protein [Nevskia sp.]